MKVEFDKIGKDCEICIAKPVGCKTCERNPNLIKLKDNFKRPDKKPPAPTVNDDVSRGKIAEKNRAELASWGYHAPQAPLSDRFQPPADDQQKQASDPTPPADLDV